MSRPHNPLLQRPGRAMTPAEFRCTRDTLGLPAGWLAGRLDVTVRTVGKWESGESPIPPGATRELEDAADAMEHLIARLREHHTTQNAVVMGVPRTDADAARMKPAHDYPAAFWQRAAAAVARSGGAVEWME